MKKNELYSIVIPIYFVLLDLLLKYFTDLSLYSFNTIIFSYLYGAVLVGVSYLIKNIKFKKLYLIAIVVIACVLAISQTIYYTYFKNFYSFTYLTNVKELFMVKGETIKAFKFEYLFFILICLITIIYILKIKFELKKGFKVLLSFAISILFFSAGFNLNKYDMFEGKNYDVFSDEYLYNHLISKSEAIEKFGLFSYAERDLIRIIERKIEKQSEEELKRIDDYFVDNKYKLVENEKTNIFEGKNLVLILCESVNTWAIEENITPTLYKMKTEGIYFNNYYAPLYPSNTIDAEFMVNTGLVPSLDYGSTAYVFGDNTYKQSLAKLFKEKGYSANSYHNSVGSFYNRFQFHNSLGYERMFDSDVLDIETPEMIGANWAMDIELFDKASQIMIENYSDTPFFSYMMTVSAHSPYNSTRVKLKENYEYVNKYLSDVNEQIKYYLAGANDLDNGLKLMLKRFEDEGILENTVFILFGDHYPYGIGKEIRDSYCQMDEYDDKKTPLLIWSPGIEAEQVDEICGQGEVFPTICNMFGLDYDPTYCYGNDIFNEDHNVIPLGNRDGWIDENLIYKNGNIVKLIKRDADISYIYDRNAWLIERLNIFQKVLEQDYFK